MGDQPGGSILWDYCVPMGTVLMFDWLKAHSAQSWLPDPSESRRHFVDPL